MKIRYKEDAVSDHGGLTGLGDDDHLQYLTAARGDLLYPGLVIPSAIDNFVSFSDIIGAQQDSGYNAADFAPIAMGVTGGDLHDHVGGDGAQIDHGGLNGLGDNDHPQYLLALGVTLPVRSTTLVIAANDSAPQSKLQADYVCVGLNDGLTIEAAIAALPASNGKITLLEGTYNIGAPIDILKSNITIEGQGWGTLLYLSNGSNCSVIVVGDGATGRTDVVIKDLAICGNSANNPTGSYMINLYGSAGSNNTSCVVDKCYLYDGKDHGIYVNYSKYTTIHDCKTSMILNKAGVKTNYSQHLLVDSCTFLSLSGATASGVFLFSSSTHGIIRNCQGYDIFYFVQVDSSSHWASINGNTCQCPSGPNTWLVYIGGSTDCQIIGNTLTAGYLTNTGNTKGVGIRDASHRCIVIGNSIMMNTSITATGLGIDVYNSNYILIKGNKTIGGNYGLYVDGSNKCQIEGNELLATNADGMQILATSSYNLVNGNMVFGGSQSLDNSFSGIRNLGDYNRFEANTIKHEGGAKQFQYGINSSGSHNLIINNDLHLSGKTAPLNDTGTLTSVLGNKGESPSQIKIYRFAKNTSGGALGAGDVVILKSVAAGNEIATTTTGGSDNVYGMVAETIANNASGFVLIEGKTTQLKVDGTTDIAIGDFISTFTTAKIAKKASAGELAFAISLESYATNDSAGVIDAILIKPRRIGASGLYVPYTGATANVDLGVYSLTANILKATADGTIWSDGTTGVTPTSGAGTRLMWIPAKYAFRAGKVTATQWDAANIGNGSVAFGENTIASGANSAAFGLSNEASGIASFVVGVNNTASGQSSFIAGEYCQATSYACCAIGYYNINNGQYSTAIGTSNTIGTGSEGAVAIGGVVIIADGGYGDIGVGSLITINGIYNIGIGLGLTLGGSFFNIGIGTNMSVDATSFVVGEVGTGDFAAIGIGYCEGDPYTFHIYGTGSIGIGTNINTSATFAVAIGSNISNAIASSLVIGFGTVGIRIQETAITIGSGKAGIDYTLTFDGETNDGVLTWMEDEDYFKLNDDILLLDNEKLYLGTGLDLQLYHNGTDSFIYNDTGILKIQDAGSGIQIGTASTELISFFGAASVNRPDALTVQLTTITYVEPGTPDYIIQTVQLAGYGFATADEGNTLLKVVANLQTRAAEIEARLEELGLIALN